MGRLAALRGTGNILGVSATPTCRYTSGKIIIMHYCMDHNTCAAYRQSLWHRAGNAAGSSLAMTCTLEACLYLFSMKRRNQEKSILIESVLDVFKVYISSILIPTRRFYGC